MCLALIRGIVGLRAPPGLSGFEIHSYVLVAVAYRGDFSNNVYYSRTLSGNYLQIVCELSGELGGQMIGNS